MCHYYPGMLYCELECKRGPKCSIRSHQHDTSLSEYFNLPRYFVEINRRFVFDNKKYIDIYESLLSEKIPKHRHKQLIIDMLQDIEHVNAKLKQIFVIVLYFILTTDVYKVYRIIRPEFDAAIKRKFKEFMDYQNIRVFVMYMKRKFSHKLI